MQWAVLSIVLSAGCACSRDLVPDNVLEGLHKPVIKSVSPAAIRVSNAGFFLDVALNAEDDHYVLYLNDRQIFTADPGSWRSSVGYMISRELLNELLAASPNGAILNVRVTGISANYDISADFEKYRDYVSDPVPIEIRKGETQFSEAKQMFPEWTHSRGPVIRCDPQGNICLAWLERLNGVDQAFFSFSADGGETWSQVLNISRSGDWVEDVDLASDGAGHFFMAWMVDDPYTPGSDIYFCRSLDNGASWYLPKRMNANGEYAREPALAVSERGDVYLAWKQDSGFPLAVSANLGNSWKANDFAASAGYYFWPPLLSARPGGQVVLFNGIGQMNNDLVFDLHSSLDYGNTWQKEEFAVGDAYPDATHPLLRFGPANQVNISWAAATTMGRIASHSNHFLRRENSGAWAAIQNLDDFCPAAVGAGVALAVSAASVDVMMTGRGCLFLLRSMDAGRSWPVPETVSGTEGYNVSGFQDMVLHPSGKTFLVFVRMSSQADGDLYLTHFE
jgi:hypothetical protein